MAILGTTFIKAINLSKERREQIENYIKNLDFKKEIPICIYFDEDVNDVLVDYRRLDYLVILNPQMELSVIEKRLQEKGVLIQSLAEHPTFKRSPATVTLQFSRNLDEVMIEEAKRNIKLMSLKINSKSFVDKIEFDKNECLIYLNCFKDLVAYVLFEQIRWYVRTGDFPNDLLIKIEGKTPFNIINDNDYYLGFSSKDKEAMLINSRRKQTIF